MAQLMKCSTHLVAGSGFNSSSASRHVTPVSVAQCHHVRAVSMPGAARGLSTRTSHVPRLSIIPAAAPGGGSGSAGGSSGGNGGSGGEGPMGGAPGGGSHPMRPWSFAFAALLAAGGIAGFIRRGSKQSLAAGLSASLIMALAARAMAGATPLAGARVGFGLCLALGALFVSRFARSKKVFPAGVVAGLSLCMSAGFLATGL